MSSAASGQQGELEVREARIAATVRPRLSDKIRRWYVIAAAALLNAIILFLLVNLVLYAIILARRPAKSLTPMVPAVEDRIRKEAYPGWREEDVNTLLNETWGGRRRSMVEYEPFTGFRERPPPRRVRKRRSRWLSVFQRSGAVATASGSVQCVCVWGLDYVRDWSAR